MLIRFSEMLKQVAGMNLKQMTKELPAGSTLWHYGILSKIGEGGAVARILGEPDTPQN